MQDGPKYAVHIKYVGRDELAHNVRALYGTSLNGASRPTMCELYAERTLCGTDLMQGGSARITTRNRHDI